jgi:hypothetical protein
MQDNAKFMTPVSALSVESRSEFIWKCYAHVVGAILAFAAISSYLYQSGVSENLVGPMMQHPFIVLGGFILAGWGATHMAHRLESSMAQYGALALLVTVWSLMFAPMLYIAAEYKPGVIDSAAGVTILGSIGLIATAMITRKDFSFLRGMLVWGGILALVGIFSSIIFGFQLGTWFSVAMIGFAGAAVLYDTSNILHHFPQDKYVAASMQLFASIAMMFWYILRLFMGRD